MTTTYEHGADAFATRTSGVLDELESGGQLKRLQTEVRN